MQYSRNYKKLHFIWPLFFIVLYILLMPYKSYGGLSFFITISPSDIMLLFAAVSFILISLFSQQVRLPKLLFVDSLLMVGLIVASGLSIFVNNGDNIAYTVFLLTWLVTIYWLVALIGSSPVALKLIIRTVIITAIIAAIIAVSQSIFELFLNLGRPAPARKIGSITIPVLRSAGPYGTYGNYGMLLIVSLPVLLLSRLEFERQTIFPTRSVLNLGVLILSLGIFISQTRGTWIVAVIVTASTIFVHYKQTYPSEQTRQILLLGFLTAIPIGILSLVVLMRMNMNTVLTRLEVYMTSIRVFAETPIFGVGYQNFIPTAAEYGVRTAVHNVFLETLVSTGLIGICIFGIFMFRIAIRISRVLSQSSEASILSVSIQIGAIGAIGQAQVVRGLYAQEFWLVLGLATAAYFMTYWSPSGEEFGPR